MRLHKFARTNIVKPPDECSLCICCLTIKVSHRRRSLLSECRPLLSKCWSPTWDDANSRGRSKRSQRDARGRQV